MTVRENVHRIVDQLPEEQLEDLLDYLEECRRGRGVERGDSRRD